MQKSCGGTPFYRIRRNNASLHEMILDHVRDALQIHGVAFSLIRESSASTRTARINLTIRDLFDH